MTAQLNLKPSTVLLTALGLLYKGQNFIVYMPDYPSDSKTKILTPPEFGINRSSLLYLETSDKVTIQAYLLAQPNINLKINSTSKKNETYLAKDSSVANPTYTPNLMKNRLAPKQQITTLLYFHANAGNFGHRLPIASTFYNQLKLNVVLVSYRGYGNSQGKPEENGLKEDAQTALNFILNHDQLKLGKIVVYGQSLGGAVAIDLVCKNLDKVHGLIVENTFMSIPKMVDTLLPKSNGLMGFTKFFCTQNWDSFSQIGKLSKLPVLFLSGSNDTLIHSSHMENLFLESLGQSHIPFQQFCDQLQNDQEIDDNQTENNVRDSMEESYDLSQVRIFNKDFKTFVSLINGNHNDTFTKPNYFKVIKNFLNNNKLI